MSWSCTWCLKSSINVQHVQGDSGGRIPRFVDLDLGSSPGCWAATVATYCPSRMVELPKYKSTKPRFAPDGSPCRGFLCEPAVSVDIIV